MNKSGFNQDNKKRGPAQRDDQSDNRSRRPRGGQGFDRNEQSEWQERVIQVRRVTKVVKGGKNFSFSALVVIGDGKGTIGVAFGKAGEVVDAVKKGIEGAKKNLVKLPFDKGSIPHNSSGVYGSAEIDIFRAPKGTGLIAAHMIKQALELAGLHNVVCKLRGASNPANALWALLDGIKNIKTRSQLKTLRGQVVHM